MNLDRYHEQHADIRQQVKDLQQRIEPEALAADPGAARQSLVTLGARLNIHLAFEDTALYPTVLKHPDPRVQQRTRQYMEEMGGIKAALKEHLQRWLSTGRVQAEAPTFRKETLAILQALGTRLEAEDRDFYPMLETLAV